MNPIKSETIIEIDGSFSFKRTFPNGSIIYLNSIYAYHRIDGPAVILFGVQENYWLDGRPVRYPEFAADPRTKVHREKLIKFLKPPISYRMLTCIKKALAKTGMKPSDIHKLIKTAKLGNL